MLFIHRLFTFLPLLLNTKPIPIHNHRIKEIKDKRRSRFNNDVECFEILLGTVHYAALMDSRLFHAMR